VAAAFVIDRFDRKRALLAIYGGFVCATALCGLAPGFELLLAARVVAGLFGGVLGALILAIVADVVPYSRRARANALVASAFSLAAVVGVPLGLWFAAQYTWRAPFLVLAATTVVIGVAGNAAVAVVDDASRRVGPAPPDRTAAGDLRRAEPPARVRIHAVADVRGLHRDSLHRRVQRRERRAVRARHNYIYLIGGLGTLVTAQVIGALADRYGKKRVFTIVAVLSMAPLLITTHLPRLPLAWVLPFSTLFFVLVPGRFGPAMALISGSAEPRLRGSFMSFNAAVQQFGAGMSALVAGIIIGRGQDGALTNYDWVGWLAVGFTLVAIVLARHIRVVESGVRVAE
jgi:predicted MFS family arabinose efflux permease